MKFSLSFKTPDVLDYVLDQYESTGCGATECNAEGDNGSPGTCFDCECAEDNAFEERAQIRQCAERFIQYGECITIEFCTDTNTATVIPLRK